LPRFAVTVVVLVLVAGTAAAFAVAERLKLERSPVTPTDFTREFSPVCDCDTAEATLRLRFRRPETVTATIVGPSGEVVRTLAERERVDPGPHVYTWDGRDEAGAIAPDGRYLLRLRFVDERRSILVPTTIRLDTQPPRLRAVRHRPDVISPDGDGHGDRLRVVYRTNERHTAELVVDGSRQVRTRVRAPRMRHGLQWFGRVSDESGGVVERVPAAKGEHAVELVVSDLAGNRSSSEFTVRVRYIELDRSAYEVQPGGTLTFTVDTDAAEFAWYLYRPRAGRLRMPVLFQTGVTEPTVEVPIPADARPGTYILRVIEDDRRARATVSVTPAGS
jgi:hypothetical protein